MSPVDGECYHARSRGNKSSQGAPVQHFNASDGCRLAYTIDDFTDPWLRAPTLLLLHAAMGHSRRYYAWVPKLSRHYCVVRMDLRGHGESGVPPAEPALSMERLVQDTREHVALERSQHPRVESSLSFGDVFLRTSLTDRNLFAASQAGLVNNLNDGMSWGIFPLFFAAAGLDVERIGILKGVYPAIWGILQVVTGPLSDRWGRKGLIVVRITPPATVSVSDDGPGVPPQHRERVFEPFYRLGGLSRGVGLGLNLVREIVRLHGGSVAIVEGETGGACVTMTFSPMKANT